MTEANKYELVYQGTKCKLIDSRTLRVRDVILSLSRNNEKIDVQFGTKEGKSSNRASIKQKNTTIDLLSINDVRRGCFTDTFNEFLLRFEEENKKEVEEKSFSIHFGDNLTNNYSLVTASRQQADAWSNCLKEIIEETQATVQKSADFYVKQMFRKAADLFNGGDRYLTLENCKKALKMFNVVVDEEKLKKTFSEANFSAELYKGHEVLDEDEFLRFYQIISERPTLDKLFKSLAVEETSSNKDKLGAEGQEKKINERFIYPEKLRDFLVSQQGMDANTTTVDYARDLIKRFESEPTATKLSQDGFRGLMITQFGDVIRDEVKDVHQPMDQPITHYWLKSSHNTYMIANQLVGKSTIEGYRLALLKRCACVEIDIHNGKDGRPIVTHGNTMVKEVKARDVLEDGIKPFAFAKNDYPVILSVEDHMNQEQRERFIKDLHEVFGDMLYQEELSGGKIPSPEELKGKIIIKSKKKLYGNLVNIYDSASFPKECITKGAPFPENCQVNSLSEHDINALIRPTLMEMLKLDYKSVEIRRQRFREYTTRANVRVFPGFHRQLSGNFSTSEVANVGVQMVAMNVQTDCESLAINEGRFRANGDCGFVLKPPILLYPNAKRIPAKRLRLRIISAQNLSRHPDQTNSVVNPTVKVTIDGELRDKAVKRTSRIRSNGLNPVWNTDMEFLIDCPELAVILFTVRHLEGRTILGKKKKYTIGEYALPVTSLAVGYRHVPLQEKSQSISLASLFVKVEITDYQPNPK